MKKYLSMEIFDPRVKGKKRQIKAADLLVERLLEEAMRNPAAMWPLIKEFIDRDEGRTDGKNAVGSDSPDDIARKIREAKAQMRASVPGSAIEEEAEDAEVEIVEE